MSSEFASGVCAERQDRRQSRAPRTSDRRIGDPLIARLREEARYQAIVRFIPSSSLNIGFQPSTRAPSRRRAHCRGISALRLVANVGGSDEPMSVRIRSDEVEDRHLDLVREVEGLPARAPDPPRASRRAACRRPRHPRRRSSRGRTCRRSGSTGRSLAEHGANRPGDDPVPVQVPAAVEVPAAGDRDAASRRWRRRPAQSGPRTTC